MMKDIQLLAKSILYEDNHLLIVSKDAGVLVQGDKTGDKTLLDLYKHYLKEVYEKPGNVFLGLVHRKRHCCFGQDVKRVG